MTSTRLLSEDGNGSSRSPCTASTPLLLAHLIDRWSQSVANTLAFGRTERMTAATAPLPVQRSIAIPSEASRVAQARSSGLQVISHGPGMPPSRMAVRSDLGPLGRGAYRRGA